MSPEIIGAIGVIFLCGYLFSGMWVGLTMGIIGFFGYGYIAGFEEATQILRVQPYTTIASYTMAAAPLFLLMGNVVSSTGVATDLYNTAYKWVGQVRCGLAMATCLACGAFAAICGSSMAALVTIGKVALPEMEKYKYDSGLATGVIAAGSTIGILIPPSLAFIFYGILTEQSVGKLFMAGIIPGLLEVGFYIAVLIFIGRFKPHLGPPGPRTTIKEKVVSLKDTWAMLALFLLVIGGIYGGIFTPTEAGAVGAFGAILITTVSGRLKLEGLKTAVLDTAQTGAMLVFLIIGAFIFMRFVTISGLPFLMAETIANLAIPAIGIIIVIMLFYIVLGMFMDVFAAILLTVPILVPVVTALGYDLIWFGVLVVRIIEIGLVTPPVGMNVFILSSASGVSVGKIYRGVLPFVAADFAEIALLVAFPVLSLFLPNSM